MGNRILFYDFPTEQAISIAQQVLEDLRSLAYSDMASRSETVTWKGRKFNALWHVSEDDPQPGHATVRKR